jgi:hypothetical protein
MAGPQSSGFPDLRADESEQLLAYDPPDALDGGQLWKCSAFDGYDRRACGKLINRTGSFLDPMSSDVIVGYR